MKIEICTNTVAALTLVVLAVSLPTACTFGTASRNNSDVRIAEASAVATAVSSCHEVKKAKAKEPDCQIVKFHN
jgi:cytochrome c553